MTLLVVLTIKMYKRSPTDGAKKPAVSYFDDNAIPKPPSDFLMKSDLKPPKRRAPIRKNDSSSVSASSTKSSTLSIPNSNLGSKSKFKIREYGPEYIV